MQHALLHQVDQWFGAEKVQLGKHWMSHIIPSRSIFCVRCAQEYRREREREREGGEGVRKVEGLEPAILYKQAMTLEDRGW